MRGYHRLLDGIVAGRAGPPPVVEAMRLPGIDGWADGRVWGTWDVDPVVVGPGGVFGGYLAAVADSFSGICMYTVLEDGQWLATRELTLRFLLPVTGGRVRTESSVVRTEGRRVWIDTVFRTDDGTKVCTARAVQVVVAGQPPAPRPTAPSTAPSGDTSHARIPQ
ncbi:PaaI family thioesterase [Streptomyces caatingaensis]|uniref:PaaI family thioesterase n=1 Tax=Streptomyces caatingaensis TaxID=1678637 RepID=UPI00069F3A81|nr:PaaI family thioesterase [Streptomyces caatingaensis]